jgi:tetratricopeptide (TPR) repeat protein
MMRVSNVGVVCVICLLVSSGADSHEVMLDVKISMDNATYLEGEEIYLSEEITNVGTQRACGIKSGGILRDSEGREIDKLHGSGFGVESCMDPGETDIHDIHLRDFGRLVCEEIWWGYRYLPADQYVLERVYTLNRDDVKQNKWSTQIEFVVVAPTGDNARAYALYRGAQESTLRRSKWQKSIELYEEVIGSYGSTPYAQQACRTLTYLLTLQGDYERALKKSLEFIDKYPDSRHVYWFGTLTVVECLENLGKFGFQINNELTRLAERYPGTKTEKAMQKELLKR